MKLPPGLTEEEFVRVLNEVVGVLAHNYVFGYYDLDDIKQHAYVFAVEAMDRYDPARPLPNFLYVHMRNRLSNLRRNEYRRTDPPCNLCHSGRKEEHPDREFCEKYKKWKKRNDTKANLMRPLDIAFVADEHERNMKTESGAEDAARVRELEQKIDRELPVELRSTYLRVRAHEPVSKTAKAAVEKAVREILGCR